MSKRRVVTAPFYVCLTGDRGAVLAMGELEQVQATVTFLYGSCVAALQVTEETALSLQAVGFGVVTPIERPR